jgi:hypothetical protein
MLVSTISIQRPSVVVCTSYPSYAGGIGGRISVRPTLGKNCKTLSEKELKANRAGWGMYGSSGRVLPLFEVAQYLKQINNKKKKWY